MKMQFLHTLKNSGTLHKIESCLISDSFFFPQPQKGSGINVHSWLARWYKSQQAAFMLRCEASSPQCPAVHILSMTCSEIKPNKVASGIMPYTNCCNYLHGCGRFICFKPLLSDIMKLIIKCAKGEARRNLVNLFFLWFSPLHCIYIGLEELGHFADGLGSINSYLNLHEPSITGSSPDFSRKDKPQLSM